MMTMEPHDDLSEATRRKLSELGIPKEKHSFESLLAFFPAEFKIDLPRLELSVLAEVLIHFVQKNIVRLPRRADVPEASPGDHVCQFYRDRNDFLDLTASYLREGLKRKEACLWVLPDWLSETKAIERLSADIADVRQFIDRGQLRIVDRRQVYSDEFGAMGLKELLEGWAAKEREALTAGYAALRVAGETGWIRTSDGLRRFIDYECRAQAMVGGMKVVGLCCYPIDGLKPTEIAGVMAGHHRTIVKQEQRWRVMRNLPHPPVDDVLAAFSAGAR